MKEKNFSYTIPDGPHAGKTLWSGRYTAVTAVVVVKIPVGNTDNPNTRKFVLVSKRGPGCPDYVGKWNIQCGYLENFESGEEACARETFEETGVTVDASSFKLWQVQTDPDKDKNVCLRYIADLNSFPKDNKGYKSTYERGGEKNEVDEVVWMNIDDMDNFEWAFNHKELLNQIKNGEY